MHAMDPANPIDAVTHRDPYPYYARLLQGPPLVHHDKLRLWVAARASTVTEVLENTAVRVRPSNEKVPAALVAAPAGEVFGWLVRMNDGVGHRLPKLALQRALASIAPQHVTERTHRIARIGLPRSADAGTLNGWIMRTPVRVVADLLGFRENETDAIVAWVRDFVACLSPLSTPAQWVSASSAAMGLCARLVEMLKQTQADDDSLIGAVLGQAKAVGWHNTPSLVANLAGLLSQTFEATAGLLGNAIVALASQPGLLHEVRAVPDGWNQLLRETSRFDSPVQNTRRFVAEHTRMAGVDLEPDSVVLLVLAAANRDPDANARPDEFLLDRPDRRVFGFGHGAHACPGQALALTIAGAALQTLFDGSSFDGLADLRWHHRPSVNARLPEFLPTTYIWRRP
jgi:cytochrome P450